MKYFMAILFGLIFSIAGLATSPAHSEEILGDLDYLSPIIGLCADAEPEAYLVLCDRFTTEQGSINCLATGKGYYFQTCLLDFCGRFTTENGVLGCMREGREKEFSDGEIEFCNRFTTEKGALGCLQQSGLATEPGWRTDLLPRLEAINTLMNQEQFYRAQHRLRNLIKDIRRH